MFYVLGSEKLKNFAPNGFDMALNLLRISPIEWGGIKPLDQLCKSG